MQQVPKLKLMLTWIAKCLLWECLDVISYFNGFIIYHISGHVNNGVDILTNQTSGYVIRKGQFHIKRPMFVDAKVYSLDRPVQPVHETDLTACQTGLTTCPIENTKSALVAQSHDAAEVSVWEQFFIDYQQISSCIKVRHFIFSYVLIMSYAIEMLKVCS